MQALQGAERVACIRPHIRRSRVWTLQPQITNRWDFMQGENDAFFKVYAFDVAGFLKRGRSLVKRI